jgi:cation:H+ antiporter
MNAFLVWLQFIVCLAVIVVAGTRLAKYGDLLGEKTRLGRVWIGVVILAAITSLPELATGISSITLVNQPDLTLGDLFGSNLINLVIIAVIDLIFTRGHVLNYLGTGIVLSTVLNMLIITATAVFLLMAQNLPGISIFGHIGIYSVALFFLFLLSQWIIFRFQPESIEAQPEKSAQTAKTATISIYKLLSFFILASLATIGAGVWLAYIGSQIVGITGLSTTLVGSLFLAICTSAPEIVVSISAVRLGALDMAVGNMVGSNLFNMGVIIFIDDIFYSAGPILSVVDSVHVITALFAILMSCIIIIGITFKPRLWLKSWIGIDTAALAILYFGAILTLYLLGNQT